MTRSIGHLLEQLSLLVEGDESDRELERKARKGDDRALVMLLNVAKRRNDKALSRTVRDIAEDQARTGGIKALFALLKVAEAYKDKALSRIVDDIAFHQASNLIGTGHSHGPHGRTPNSPELRALREIGMRTFILRGHGRANSGDNNKDSDTAALKQLLGFDPGDEPEQLPSEHPE